ncbi:MAG: hypothetical protein ACKO2V_21825 [Snowella sp.]
MIVRALSLPQFWLDLSEEERRFYFREFMRHIQLIPLGSEAWKLQIEFIC